MTESDTREEDHVPMIFAETLKPSKDWLPHVFLNTYVRFEEVCLSLGNLFAVLLSSISLGDSNQNNQISTDTLPLLCLVRINVILLEVDIPLHWTSTHC